MIRGTRKPICYIGDNGKSNNRTGDGHEDIGGRTDASGEKTALGVVEVQGTPDGEDKQGGRPALGECGTEAPPAVQHPATGLVGNV